jgi:hypothetical protein
MNTVDIQKIPLYYELYGGGDKPPVLLLSGLAGVGARSSQLNRFATRYFVIVSTTVNRGLIPLLGLAQVARSGGG